MNNFCLLATNLKAQCETGEILDGGAIAEGYETYLWTCPDNSAICGLATRIYTGDLNTGDYLMLTQAYFKCCSTQNPGKETLTFSFLKKYIFTF